MRRWKMINSWLEMDINREKYHSQWDTTPSKSFIRVARSCKDAALAVSTHTDVNTCPDHTMVMPYGMTLRWMLLVRRSILSPVFSTLKTTIWHMVAPACTHAYAHARTHAKTQINLTCTHSGIHSHTHYLCPYFLPSTIHHSVLNC